MSHPKLVTILCLLFITFCHALTHAQYFSPRIDVISFLRPDYPKLKASLEVAFHRNLSINLGFEGGTYKIDYHTHSNAAGQTEKTVAYTVNGYGYLVELRIYPFTKKYPAPIGVFFAPYARYGKMIESYQGLTNNGSWYPTVLQTESTGTGYHGGITCGYKVNLGVFAMEVLLGSAFGKVTYDEPNQRHLIPASHTAKSDFKFMTRAELSLGFVFPKVKRTKEKHAVSTYEVRPENDSTLGEMSKLIIYRMPTNKGHVTKYQLFLDGELLKTMGNGSYTEIKRLPGFVTFEARIGSKKSLSLQLEKGKVYYIRCGINSGILLDEPVIEQMAPEVGKYESGEAQWILTH